MNKPMISKNALEAGDFVTIAGRDHKVLFVSTNFSGDVILRPLPWIHRSMATLNPSTHGKLVKITKGQKFKANGEDFEASERLVILYSGRPRRSRR